MNGVVATVVLILFVIGEIRGGQRQDVDWRPVAWAATAFAIVIVWMVAQMIPGMPATLHHPLWTELAGSLPDASPTIGINASSTWTTIVEVVPIGFLAVVALRLAIEPRRAAVLLKVIVFATTLVASWGLIAQYFGFKQVILTDYDGYPGFLTGTFVGRNAAATYFVIGIAVSTALIASRLEGIVHGGRRRSRNSFLVAAEATRRAGILLVADLVLAAALLNTGSRAGFIAGGVALLTITLVSLRRASARGQRSAAGFVAVLGAILVVTFISGDRLFGRLEQGVSSGDRMLVYRDTIDMIAARPWLGHGAGTFVDAFPLYQVLSASSGAWDRAHNSYLQAAAELGLPALGLLVFAILVLVGTMLRRLGDPNQSRPASVAGIAVLAAVALHSLVDFSVQIQAVGLTVVVLLGAGAGEALGTLARVRGLDRRTSPSQEAQRFQHREVIDVTIPTSSRTTKAGSA